MIDRAVKIMSGDARHVMRAVVRLSSNGRDAVTLDTISSCCSGIPERRLRNAVSELDLIGLVVFRREDKDVTLPLSRPDADKLMDALR